MIIILRYGFSFFSETYFYRKSFQVIITKSFIDGFSFLLLAFEVFILHYSSTTNVKRCVAKLGYDNGQAEAVD